MNTVFNQVAALFQNIDASVAFANEVDAMYRRSQGQEPAPFGADNEQDVATNLAALYAAEQTAEIFVVTQHGEVGLTEERFTATLARLGAGGDLGEVLGGIADRQANLAWRQGNAFRGLKRITRHINTPFALLPADERKKDRDQITLAANFILRWLNDSKNQAAA